ncbi:MAG: nitric oxide reductase activation protein NorD, partial [Firmicutes bacterium]|nr:nitric oxide reductase activation protein NorD [Bacillota bacterium]
QFFVSRILAGHFVDMAAAQTRRYGHNRRVKVRIVWEPKNDNLAYTHFEQIWINAGHPMVKKKRSRPERYTMVCGLFTHELGHILYTDFLSPQTQRNKLAMGQWYPEKPLLRSRDEQRHEADIWDFCKKDPMHLQVLCRIAHNLHNVLEDGYIDNKMITRYPGVLGQSLQTWSQSQFEDAPTLTQLIEAEEAGDSHIWINIVNLILSHALWGELKYGDEPTSDERVQTVFGLLSELDDALLKPSSKERLNTVNTIVVRCWPYIKDYIEWCIQESKKNGTGDPSGVAAGTMPSASAAAEGGTTPVAEAPGTKPKLANKGKRAATAQLAAAAASSNDDESESGEAAGGTDENESESGEGTSGGAEGDQETEAGVIMPPGDDAAGETPAKAQDVSAEETGRIPMTETDDLFEPMGGEAEFDDDYAGTGYDNAAADIERLLDQVAEAKVHEELEDARKRELNELANSLSYGNVHAGVQFNVHRMKTVDDELKEKYQTIAGPLLQISKQLQRSILQQLKDQRQGGKQTGLLMGRRLNTPALPRNDGRAFYKNNLPIEVPRIAVALVDDESGSMSSKDRATYARAASIILYDFCRALDIPVMVYGHSTSDYDVDLYSYAEFEAIDRNDCYRLMDISARGSNRDGAALRFVAEQLSRRQEEVKILMLISDGQPAHIGYMGTAAEEDLRGIQREYERKGLLFIAAAIGDDREHLQRIYGKGYMDISDLTQLPMKLTSRIKRYIRV